MNTVHLAILKLISVAGWLHAAPFHHQDGRPCGCSGAMYNPSRNGVPLVGFEGYRLILQINQKPALEDEKELVLFIVLVPMEFPLHHAKTNDTIVHLAKGLIEPLFLARGDQARHID